MKIEPRIALSLACAILCCYACRDFDATAPRGFAAYEDSAASQRFRAVSSDGVMFTVRSERHKPQAELSFWHEALKSRMLAAGYALVGEQEIEASGTSGQLLELAAPLGALDYSYLVALFVTQRRIYIAEAAGEVTRLNAHKSAILDAIRAIEPRRRKL